jgi:phosphotriesterase-related protein
VSPIQTVLSPVTADEVTAVDAHAHVWLDPPGGGPGLRDEGAACAELRALRAAGGDLVVDCQPGGSGRDGARLARLSAASGIRIVASTGYHQRRLHAPGGPWDAPADAAEHFARELRDGLDEAPAVRAGVVKAVWTDAGGVEDELLTAALDAARHAGAATVVHVEATGELDHLLALLDRAGAVPGTVQLSHLDKRPDAGLHRELARAGHVLGYDTFVRPKHRPAERVWPLLEAMIEAGLDHAVTLGLDLVEPDQWSVGGGPGLRALPAVVLPELERRGATAAQLRGLGSGNALRLLTRAGAGVPA